MTQQVNLYRNFRRPITIWLTAMALIAVLAACAAPAAPTVAPTAEQPTQPPAATQAPAPTEAPTQPPAVSVSFTQDIQPILEKSCLNCHGAKTVSRAAYP